MGPGILTVVQDQPWGEPYTSQIPLISGEIGEDLAAYFVQSEQIATSVGVGVLVDTDLSVRQAGGFVIQLLPGFDDKTVEHLETNLAGIASVTDLFENGMAPLDILELALDGLDFRALEATPLEFACNCSRERTSRVLIALGPEELQSLVDDGKPTELVCNFCNKKYEFGVDELQSLLDEATRK